MIFIVLTTILINSIFAPLGCIALWKKYVNFGDGLAHSSLLAGVISILLHIPLLYAGFIVAVCFAIIIFALKEKNTTNSITNIVSGTMLSLALIIGSIYPVQVNINNLLFGDILYASSDDVLILIGMLVLVVGFIFCFYDKIILIIINRDIAQIKGVNVKKIELLYLILLSLSVFLTIKIVGSLLVINILLIPAMTARLVSRTPLQMIVRSAIIAIMTNLLGLILSFYLDIPTTPLIIAIGATVYFVFHGVGYMKAS